ncbi:MAG: hypothetical protein ACI4PQ_08460 [Butyricicoccaceae bacterium]
MFLSALVLVGCTAVKDPAARAEDVRARYAGAQTVTLDAKITADLGERTSEYGLHCGWDGVESEITVTAPASIAGITANVSENGTVLEFDGAELETAMPARTGQTPLDAVPCALEDLARGEPEQVWEEENTLVLRYETQTEEGVVAKEIACDAASLALSSVQVYFNGERVLTCTVENCTLSE